MNFSKELMDLQLFAGEGTGEGASAGETSADAGQARLLELGVPEEKLRRRAQYNVQKSSPAAQPAKAEAEPTEESIEQQDAAAETTEETQTEAKPKMTWEEVVADPELNKRLQSMVQSRLKNARAAEENLGKLAPALEVLARKYNMDPENPDYEAIAKAVNNDRDFYEDLAIEKGESIESVMQTDQQERTTARQRREEARTLEQQRIQNHLRGLELQGEEMKKVFPSFDLKRELANPAFARMTAPNVGISVMDAYYAVHRNEIQQAAMQATAQKTAEKISNAIQAGQRRPSENGTSGQAPSKTRFDYSKASKEQREAIKKEIRDAAAEGKKLYPGRW